MQLSRSLYKETEQKLTTEGATWQKANNRTEGKQQGERDLKKLCCRPWRGKGGHEQRMWVGSGNWKGQGTGCPLQPPERPQPCQPILDSDLHTVRQYICMVLSHWIWGNLLQKQSETHRHDRVKWWTLCSVRRGRQLSSLLPSSEYLFVSRRFSKRLTSQYYSSKVKGL